MSATSGSGAYELDDDRKFVRRGEQSWRVRPREYQLLKFLHANRGKVMSRQEILCAMFGDASPFAEIDNVSVTIWNLRKHVAPDVVDTVRGYGFGVGVQ